MAEKIENENKEIIELIDQFVVRQRKEIKSQVVSRQTQLATLEQQLLLARRELEIEQQKLSRAKIDFKRKIEQHQSGVDEVVRSMLVEADQAIKECQKVDSSFEKHGWRKYTPSFQSAHRIRK
eukprot:c1130_g1_i1.p1 GENE.c1130_g1_i1~~c1130_g1_i1.p1  ORF type:complete len:123 (-),score=21.98 c1130_g1_i1:63-431(-)